MSMYQIEDSKTDYSSFPLEVLEQALKDLRRLDSEGFPVSKRIITDVMVAVIQRKIDNLRE